MNRLKYWKKQDDDTIRIKVAELAGWKREDRPMFHPVQTTTEGWLHPTNGGWYGGAAHEVLPNYPQDLNAMHEAEEWMLHHDDDRWCKYMGVLTDMSMHFYIPCIQHVPARQRAEAFILTMENS